MNPKPPVRRFLLYFVLMAALVLIIWVSYRSVNVPAPSLSERSLSSLLATLKSGEVATATFKSDGVEVDWQDATGNRYKTFYPQGYQLVDRFAAAGVTFTVEPPAFSDIWLSVVLPNVILFLIIGGFMFYFFRKTQSITRKEG